MPILSPEKHQRLKDVLFIVLMILSLPLLIVAIPFAEYFYEKEQKKKRWVADAILCSACGNILGAASVDAADDRQLQRLRDAQAAAPFCKVNIGPKLIDAICTDCQARYRYEARNGIFEHIQDV